MSQRTLGLPTGRSRASDARMRQLADRSVFQEWRSSLYVFRQPFVLWPAVVGALVSGAWMLSLMVANGRATPNHVVTLVAISPVMGFGFAVLVGLPAFMIQRAFKAKPAPFAPADDETILAKERANHFLGDEGRGGELLLTDRRIVFVPHRFNVQLAAVEQALGRVRSVEWARVVNAAGLPLSHVLWVVEDERRERYVVRDAAALGARIEETAARGEHSAR